jgi:predicted YcjX-like family ATPase
VVPGYKEIGAEVGRVIDTVVKKDFKRYVIAEEVGLEVRAQAKETLVKCIGGLYGRYLKACKPENAYTMEDIQMAIDKLLKI